MVPGRGANFHHEMILEKHQQKSTKRNAFVRKNLQSFDLELLVRNVHWSRAKEQKRDGSGEMLIKGKQEQEVLPFKSLPFVHLWVSQSPGAAFRDALDNAVVVDGDMLGLLQIN